MFTRPAPKPPTRKRRGMSAALKAILGQIEQQKSQIRDLENLLKVARRTLASLERDAAIISGETPLED